MDVMAADQALPTSSEVVPADTSGSAGPSEALEKVVPGVENRSSKRKIKSTTVMVDGHIIKRSNMYTMDEGESSVWDRELGTKDDFTSSSPPPVAKKPKVAAAPRPPRQLTPQQQQRQRRNDELRALKAAALANHGAFLAPHAYVLSQFGATSPPVTSGLSFEDAMAECSEQQQCKLLRVSSLRSATLQDRVGRGQWDDGEHV